MMIGKKTENEESGLVYAAFLIRGKDLNINEITDSLGITPSHSFQRGDNRTKGRIWHHGYWEISSKEFIQSQDLAVHLSWLVDQLEPSKSTILKIIQREGVDALLDCLWIFPTEHESLSLDPILMTRLASLGVKMEIDMYGPD